MEALRLVDTWPVPHVSAAVIRPDGTVVSTGDTTFEFRLASISKPITAWASLVAAEEGTIELDAPPKHVAAQPGCTIRHLLSHAGGYPFDGADPIAPPERRRIYSNTGIEMVAAEIASAAAMPFEVYFREAVLEPLGMRATVLRGSPAHQMRSTLGDTVRFMAELRRPSLVDAATAGDAFRPQYPDLSGIVPDVGRFTPCPWGIGVEIRGVKQPHWTGRTNSPATVGHFGGAGTMAWFDPAADCALVALTDRNFDDWRDEALARWPELSDAVIHEVTAAGAGGTGVGA
jgi:CubicO group peptidase (beta-lactamase class C family)